MRLPWTAGPERRGYWRGVDAAMRAICTCKWMTPHAAMVACDFDFQVIYSGDPKCPWHSRGIITLDPGPR